MIWSGSYAVDGLQFLLAGEAIKEFRIVKQEKIVSILSSPNNIHILDNVHNTKWSTCDFNTS